MNRDGISVETSKCIDLFDEKAEAEVEKILSTNGEQTTRKDLLLRLLGNQSVHEFY